MTCSTRLILVTLLLHTWFIQAAPIDSASTLERQKRALITYGDTVTPPQFNSFGYNAQDFYFNGEAPTAPVDDPHAIFLLPDSWDSYPSTNIFPIDNTLKSRLDLAHELALEQLEELLKQQREELYNEIAGGSKSNESDLDDFDFGSGYGSGDGFDHITEFWSGFHDMEW